MLQTWHKIVRSLDSGILGMSRFTFGKPAFAIILLSIVANLAMLPGRISYVRNRKKIADRQNNFRSEIAAIEEKYRPEPDQPLSFEETRQKGEEINQLHQENSITLKSFVKSLPRLPFNGVIVLTSLGGIAATMAIDGIRKDERFTEGGILWFKDLTKPDPYMILPVAQVGILMIRRFIKPLQFSQKQSPTTPTLELIEQVANLDETLTMVSLLGLLARNNHRTAAQGLFVVTKTGIELVEDYFIRRLIIKE